MKKTRNLVVVLLIILLSSSCKTAKDITMFQEGKNELSQMEIARESFEFKIKPYDNLYINISTLDPEVNQLFNPNMAGGGSATSTTQMFGDPVGQYINGYRVNVDSLIYLPILGEVNLVGMNLEEARERIIERANEYLKEPIVQVKFLNYKVNLSGEVAGPGIYYNYEARLNIYDAISMAGGITDFADLENVIIKRYDGDRVYTHKANLTDNSAFTSEIYYLQPNDLVYIPPSNLKRRNINTGTYSIFLGTLSMALVLISFFNLK